MLRSRLAASAAAAFLSLALLPAQAIPPGEYLKLRRDSGFDPKVTYQVVSGNPAAYSGKVVELRGTVSGTLTKSDGVSFLLATGAKDAILLEVSGADTAIITRENRQPIRVLAKVSPDVIGNVPKLEIIGITNDAEITLREKQAAAATTPQPRPADQTRMPVDRSGTGLASRGLTLRPVGAAVGGLSEMARKYLTPEAQAIYPVYKQFIFRQNKRLTEQELDSTTVSLLHFSQRFRVDPRLVVALVVAESSFDPRSTSHKGAMGLGQLMPSEVQTLKLANPYDPVWNLRGAIDQLKGKLDIFREPGTPDGQFTWRQIQLALAAYNAGVGAVKRHGGIPPYKETQNYVAKVTKMYRELLGATN